VHSIPHPQKSKIHLDSSESSGPIDVDQKELRDTNSLVEEFLLLANISVATKIQETFPQIGGTQVCKRISMFQYLNELIFSGVSKMASTPPRTNFEKLQDILQKRKGLKG